MDEGSGKGGTADAGLGSMLSSPSIGDPRLLHSLSAPSQLIKVCCDPQSPAGEGGSPAWTPRPLRALAPVSKEKGTALVLIVVVAVVAEVGTGYETRWSKRRGGGFGIALKLGERAGCRVRASAFKTLTLPPLQTGMTQGLSG